MRSSRSLRDKNKNNPNWRDKYRNPSPPPGYVKPHSRIIRKEDCLPIESIKLRLLQLVIESGVLDVSDPDEFPIPPSDEEVVSLSVQTKVTELIDLEPDSPVSLEVECLSPPLPPPDAEPPLPPTDELPLPDKSSSKKYPSKHQKKDKEIIEEYGSSDDSSSSHRHHSRMKEKKQRRERRTISLSPPKRRRSRSRSPKREWSRSRSPMYSDHKRRAEYKKSDDKYTRSQIQPERDSDFNDAYAKQECIKQKYTNQDIGKNNLFSSYFCQYCKLSLNGKYTWISHINGKKHLKVLELKNTAKKIADSLSTTSTQMSSRCRPAPPNTYRVRTNEIADAQIVIETKLGTPCPGLEKVIEIHGLVETRYYCELCDAPCAMIALIPHLQGFKHQLKCLKLFDREAYESCHWKKRGQIEYKVTKILTEVEKKYGRGNVVVEREFKSDADQSVYSSQRDRRHRRVDLPGPSRSPVESVPESYAKSIELDTTKSHYYCKLCDSHINWGSCEQHIRGKRHLANSKKRPGEPPSKTKSVRVPDARAIIMDEIDQLNVPVVGLNQIRETQKPEINESLYNCFLCGGCMTRLDVVDHILCLKHKSKYLEHIKNDAYMMALKDMGMRETQMKNVIEENCYYVYQEEGPGEVEVYVTKNSVT